jgi:hypothetical protein
MINAGGHYFQGWYTKDGTGDDWGARVEAFPYRINADTTLYARWANARKQDGSSPWFAFDLSGKLAESDKLNVTVRGWNEEVFFEFTPAVSGNYNLMFNDKADANNRYLSWFATYTGPLTAVREQEKNAEGQILVVIYSGSYALTGGNTYYFSIVLGGRVRSSASDTSGSKLLDDASANGRAHYSVWVAKV